MNEQAPCGPDSQGLECRIDGLAEVLHCLARDLRETRQDLLKIEEALALALAKFRDLDALVGEHRRQALEALGLLERELADVTAVAANDLGSLALRLAALEEYVARRQGGEATQEAPCPSKPG